MHLSRPVSAAPHRARADAPPAPATPRPAPYDLGDLSLEGQVQGGLNLFLRLRSPAQMPALLATIARRMDATRAALGGLHYVHFARFVPTPDFSTLLVITTYDGDIKPYAMDFVGVMGDVFTDILAFIENAPRLPVQRYPNDFWAFIQANTVPVNPWSAYPHLTVIDILRAAQPR
jgi:hypothetical protein